MVEMSLRKRHVAAAASDGGCEFQPAIEGLRHSLNLALVGKADVVELVLACLLARGHILIEDLPGLGKTTLAKALARCVGGTFARVQCTPDLLPSDITGFNVFNQKTREFEFLEGPVFAHVLLADEINRATPRTQSALFESMAERQVTADRVCRRLPPTFFVIATQNPVDSHGTFPLPEAQLDRFAIRLSIGYPDRGSEVNMLAADDGLGTDNSPTAVVSPAQLEALQQHVCRVHVCDAVRGYVVDLGRATREHRRVKVGISPRGLLTWQSLARARAHLENRDFVLPDDVQAVAGPVLSIRLWGEFERSADIISEIISKVPVPTVRHSPT